MWTADIISWARLHQRNNVKRRSSLVSCFQHPRYTLHEIRLKVSRRYSSVRLRVFSFPRFVLLSNRRCFEPFVGFVALRFLRGMATL
jgi:hypothetical protein